MQAEQELRASLREIDDLKAALDEHAIVAITDPQGKITYVNDKFCAISKYAREELLGQDHRLINSGWHPKEFIRGLWTTIAHGKVWKGELKNKAKDGSFYWVDTTIVPFLDQHDKPRQYVAIRADITERKRTEEQLQGSFKEISDLKAALDEHAIVAITDPQGKITYVNDKFCAISKFSREELLGQDHRIINSGWHPKEFIRGLWTTIAHGKVWKGELKNKAKDGSFYWVDTTIVPFLNPHGKPRQYVAIRADITERKRAEEGAAHLAAIVEFSDDAIIGKDLRGVVTSWNAGAEGLFGYSAAEMIGQPISRLIPPDRLPEETEILGRIQRGESVKHFDTERMRKDGRLIPISVTVSPIRDWSGKIIGASKVARDITERKKAEQSLATSLKEVSDFKTALDEHAIVAITDPRGKITYVNDKFCAISKYSREELLGQDHRIINSGWHSREFIRELWTTIARGQVWKGEIKNKARDGSFYWVDTTIVPFLNPDGRPRQYVAIRADITDRKRAEEARLASDARYRALFEYAPDGILIATPESYYTDANATMCRMLGYTRDELIGLHGSDIVAPAEVPHIGAALREIKEESGHHREWRFRRMDGTVFSADVIATTMPDGNILAMIRDVTERKLAEARIHQLNNELEQRVTERTAQLEAANQELEAFSYSVSHDLRSPLRAVDGFSQAVLEDYGPQLPEACREDLRTIRNGAQKMGQLIDDLLTFSRLSRLPLSKSAVDTGKLVRGVLEELNYKQKGRQMDVRIAELPACQADPALLKQVWVNLLSNSLKYTGKCETGRVEIGCARENGRNVYFVRDNGTGFDMKYAHKLFGVFQRLHRAEDYEGTGVGLAIVQRIIHRHGGQVWADSAKHSGATFYFTLEGDTKP